MGLISDLDESFGNVLPTFKPKISIFKVKPSFPLWSSVSVFAHRWVLMLPPQSCLLDHFVIIVKLWCNIADYVKMPLFTCWSNTNLPKVSGLCTVPARFVQHGRSLMPVWHLDLQPEKMTITESSNGLARIDQQPYSWLCYIISCMSNARVALIHNHRSDNDQGGDVLTLWDTWAILSHKAWCPCLGNAKPVSA